MVYLGCTDTLGCVLNIMVCVRDTENSLKAASLLQVGGRLCGDQADQLLHAVVLGEEEEQPTVLGLALLQNVILLHQLSKRHVLPVQQLVDVGGGVQVELPKHGGRWDGGHSPRQVRLRGGKGVEEEGVDTSRE